MSENLRKLVTVRKIDAIDPIEGADAIVVATVEGWKVVVKKGEFNVGDPCVYFEIDSFLPTGNPAWQFLVDKSSRTFEGVVGHRLRTVKLRGQISQGLVLKVDQVPQITNFDRDFDQAELLGIVKWEAPLPACLQGQAEGLFPSFIPKTDQERCQNMKAEIFGYDEVLTPFDVSTITGEASAAMFEKGLLKFVGDEWMKVSPAKADRDARYEISMKLDGSSCTTFARLNGEAVESGVCSRNLQLKVNEANGENTFVKTAVTSGLLEALELAAKDGFELAVQAELMGPAIQGNRENLKDFKLFVFDIFDIKAGKKLAPTERMFHFDMLKRHGAQIEHAPILHTNVTLQELGLNSIDDLLKFAEGPSLNHPIREGLVFKRMDGQFSFKAISNLFLAKEKD